MKAGFLSAGAAAAGTKKKQPAQPLAAASTAAPQQQPTPATTTTRQQQQQQQKQPQRPISDAEWQQCLALLQSDSDEKKFVGLLLVTKLLPQGDDDAARAVLAAVGWPFLTRLLLPPMLAARAQPPAPGSAPATEKLQQQQLAASVALSVLSACCRLPEVAQAQELRQLARCLLGVAAGRGVAPLLMHHQGGQHASAAAAAAASWLAAGSRAASADPSTHSSPPWRGGRVLSAQTPDWADAAVDAAAATDALECLVAAAGSSSSFARTLAREHDGVSAAVHALSAAVQEAQHAARSGRAGADAAAASDAAAAARATRIAALRAAMLAMQLLGLLLEASKQGPGQGFAAQGVAGLVPDEEEVAGAIILLAFVFGGRLGGTTSSSSSSGGVDPAALQLQAQHTLLQLLPLDAAARAAAVLQRHALQEAGAAAATAAGDEDDPVLGGGGSKARVTQRSVLTAALAACPDWPAALRCGLERVLRSRVGAVQRHSALQLAAAVLELLGPAWLLPHEQPLPPPLPDSGISGGSSCSAQSPEAFLRVLVEVLAIETPLLLSDAMNPAAVVPKAQLATAARSAAAGAAGVGSSGGDGSGDVDMDAEEAEGEEEDAGADGSAARPLSVREAVEQQQQQQQQEGQQQPPQAGGQQQQWAGPPGFEQQQRPKPLKQQLAELQLKEEAPAGPHQQGAGERALACLPSCFALLEACLELLVEQVERLRELFNVDTESDSPTHYQQQQSGAGAVGGVDGSLGSVRPVSWRELLPALSDEEVQHLLSRLEQVTAVMCEFLEHATAAPAAAAANGSDSTQQQQQPDVRVDPLIILAAVRLLARFLADAPDVHTAAMRALLPQLAAYQGQHGELLPVPLFTFLLPALLQWTHQHSPQRAEWVALLVDPANTCLTTLAALVRQQAASAAQAAAACAAAVDWRSHDRRRAQQQLRGSPDDPLSMTEADRAVSALKDEEAELAPPCAVLYQLLSGLPAVLSTQGAAAAGRRGRLGLTDTQAAALAAAVGPLAALFALRQRDQQHFLQQQQQPAACSPAMAAAEACLASLAHVELQVPVLLAAAALAGQVLGCAQPQMQPQGVAAAAGLLCWGCVVGWCALVSALSAPTAGGSTADWDVDDLLEQWEACLMAAAELLADGGPAASSVLQALASPEAQRFVALARQSGADPTVPAAVDTVGLQLLLQAMPAAG